MADVNANRALIRRFIDEVWNKANLTVADEILDDSFSVKGAPYTDKAGEKEFVQNHRRAYPDMTFKITSMVAENDLVTTQIHGVGTHKGLWMGIPPTNKTVNVNGNVQFTVKGNKITEAFHNVDVAGIRMDMGVLQPNESLPRRHY
jgi:predicted ester cyclase